MKQYQSGGIEKLNKLDYQGQANKFNHYRDILKEPNYLIQLNLIERFWKFIRNECLSSKY